MRRYHTCTERDARADEYTHSTAGQYSGINSCIRSYLHAIELINPVAIQMVW